MVAPMDEPERVERQIGESISAALRASGEFVNRWVALIETVDEQGRRGIWTATSEGLTAWDSLGMLEFAKQREMAETLKGSEEQ